MDRQYVHSVRSFCILSEEGMNQISRLYFPAVTQQPESGVATPAEMEIQSQ
jgi:hypothetical protein